MPMIASIKFITSQVSSAIPQIMGTVNNIDTVVKQTSKSVKNKKKYIPLLIAWFCMISVSIVGSFICLLILLLR